MIAIIGAGPAGCYLGYLLARAGKEVHIYEEHSAIGMPVQCTGIVTEEIKKFIKLDGSFVINRVSKAIVFSKNNKAEIPLKDIVLDREKFDKHLASLAENAGAHIHLKHQYIGMKGKKAIIHNNKRNIEIEPEYLIGADGPLSQVAKSAKIFGKREFFLGMQARVKGNYDPKSFEVYFGSICPGFFAWILPESKAIARIGIASKDKKNTRKLFNRFIQLKNIKNKDLISHQAGLIPLYNPDLKVQKGNIFLLGDAAMQVKATTGGGIVQGLKAAKILSRCILNNRTSKYSKQLSNLNRELWLHLKARKMLDKFSDKDYNCILDSLNNKKIKKYLSKYNRDDPKKLIFRLLAAKPSLLKYTTKFINQL